ncbi:MAG: YhfC family glutamic-type intramembrane protease [Candidatus Verstraetearchaeota archaeon]|nr:YhfC family glutamic-type intramembrane protease [Candidatus Verstraetearchaeota archaeon]
MLNPWLILGPSGMMIVGIFSMLFWRERVKRGTGKSMPLRFFVFGGLLWAAAIIPKIIMDYTVTQPLYVWWASSFGAFGGLILLGVYVGLRTGVFECGAAYLGFMAVARRAGKTSEANGVGAPPENSAAGRNMGYREAVAVGVGFGAFEAIILGLPSLVQMASIFLDPSILSALPADQIAAIESQLSQSTWVAAAAAWERAFAILAHVFATVLAYLAVVHRRLLLLGGAIAYKSVLDAPIPIFQATLASSPYYLVITEAFVAIMGLIGLLGMLNVDRIAPGDANIIRKEQ